MKKLNRLLLLAAMTLVAVLPLRAADYVFEYDGGYLYVTNTGTVGSTEDLSASCVWTCVSSTSQLTAATLGATYHFYNNQLYTNANDFAENNPVTPTYAWTLSGDGASALEFVSGSSTGPNTIVNYSASASGNTGIFTVTSPATSGAVDITPVILAIPFPVRMPIAFSTVVRGDWLWRAEKLQVLQAA